jgi:hypothetical protein
MKKKAVTLIAFVILGLILSACLAVPPAPTPPILWPATPMTTPTAETPYPSPTAITPVPVQTPTSTLSEGQAAIESVWAVQKPLIEAGLAEVFKKTAIPFLSSVLDITTPLPDTPEGHCKAMRLWDPYFPVPDNLPQCQSDGNPLNYPGFSTIPLETRGGNDFILKVFPFLPHSRFIAGKNYNLLPAPGGAYYGMWVGDNYQVVTVCGTADTPPVNSIYLNFPYLKDAVGMFIKNPSTNVYIEVISNRNAWFSSGWTDGTGWTEMFKVCP